MNRDFIFKVVFFRTNAGREPVREWLRSLDSADRKTIGADIKLVELGWPMGMPLVKKIESHLWEMRSHLTRRRIARILFTVESSEIALLHGLIKKSQKIPLRDLKLARNRNKLWRSQEVVV